MKFTLEIPIPPGEDFPEESLLALSGHRIDIGCDRRNAMLFGQRLDGKVVGASKSPRDRILRLVVDTADNSADQ